MFSCKLRGYVGLTAQYSVHFRTISSKMLMYSGHGALECALDICEQNIDPPTDDEVLVKYCASPINPADINTIEGVYPIKKKLPAIAGNEGVGRVVECGSRIRSLTVGDLVVPSGISSGTWRTHVCGKVQDFIRLSHPLPIAHAAICGVNPGTAYRMLTDFVPLNVGDVIVQNGSTSAVGVYVIQLSKMFGYRTVCLFRQRSTPNETENTRQLLLDYGATWAVTEAEFTDKSSRVSRELNDVPPIKLALNCLGGRHAILLMKSLSNGGTMVTYGAMSRSPIPLPAGPLIFNDIILRGFWLTAWYQREGLFRRVQMLNKLTEWFSTGKLKPSPYVEIPFSDWSQALKLATFHDATPEAIKEKVIMVME